MWNVFRLFLSNGFYFFFFLPLASRSCLSWLFPSTFWQVFEPSANSFFYATYNLHLLSGVRGAGAVQGCRFPRSLLVGTTFFYAEFDR